MDLDITYELEGTGWAKCLVTSGDSRCEITASYLTDALRNLVVAATAVVSGFHSVSFGFDEEPGEFRWAIDAIQLNVCTVQILEFPQLWGSRPNAEGKVLFRAEVRPIVFASAVKKAATAVLTKHGVEGYAKMWHNDAFPSKALDLLGDAIAKAENAV